MQLTNTNKASLSAADIKQVSMLCKLAGVPAMAASFITNESSLAEVQKELLAMRAAKQAPAIASRNSLSTDPGSYAHLVKQATTAARGRKLTKEQAIAEALIQNPSAYDRFLAVDVPAFQSQCRANGFGQPISRIEIK